VHARRDRLALREDGRHAAGPQVGRCGERQSYSLSRPRQSRWKESPNVRMDPK
jgi:hypothetical protein